MITHISTNVYFDIDCLSWVFHNRASSLLLLLTVLASLSILVGDAEQQHLPTFLLYKNALLFQILRISRFYVCLVFFKFKIQLDYHYTLLSLTHTRCQTGLEGFTFSGWRRLWGSLNAFSPKLNWKQYLSGTDQNRSFGRKTGVLWKLCQPPSPCFKENSAKPSRFDTPSPSVCFTLVSIWNDPVRFLFPPSSITKLHTHLPPSCASFVFGLKFSIGCVLSCCC